jgi:DNA repair and recombination protein RAD54B
MFIIPIKKGDEPSSTEQESDLGIHQREELQHLISNFMLRRTRDIIIKYLPPKQDLVVMCKASEYQVQYY